MVAAPKFEFKTSRAQGERARGGAARQQTSFDCSVLFNFACSLLVFSDFIFPSIRCMNIWFLQRNTKRNRMRVT
jgi:hypothetical protein